MLVRVPLAQVVSQELVVAVRAGCPVDEGEHVVGHEALQRPLPVVGSRHLVGELDGHRFKAARGQHEGDRLGVFAAKSLFGEVREDVAGEARVDQRVLDGAEVRPIEGPADENEAGRPALGEAHESLGLLTGQPGVGASGEDLGDLRGVEAQVFEGHLADLVVELEPGRGDGRLEPREKNEMHVAGQIGQQIVECSVELARRDRLVVVVDDDMEIAVDLVAQLRDKQRGHLGRRHRHLVGFGEALDQDAAEGRHALADGLHQRGDEHGGVVVEDIESVPDGTPAEPARGFGDDRGLAVSGRRPYGEQPPARALGELVEHLGPNEGASDVGRGDLGGDERRSADYRATWRRAWLMPHMVAPDPGARAPDPRAPTISVARVVARRALGRARG